MINSSEFASFSSEGWQRTEITERVTVDERTQSRTTTRTIYQGKVAAGTAEGDTSIDSRPLWCLRKTVFTETSVNGETVTRVDVYYPDGRITYRHRWDCRAQDGGTAGRLPDVFAWAYLS